ncbi:hypothetical protein [Rhizobium alvei]|uniref:Uncharacterized protein n=1 Tax=Rhizobium alvei TaxID=1132659 RepID=A0ABT8YUW9_9HYPH|nr:hypothetical protein [Rhizobium alvei]MDO6967014.1 hypothetical protein [Rhizobium alvei]
MTNNAAAFTQIIKAMQQDAEDVTNWIDLAAQDMEEGRRNSAIGALCSIDDRLERLSSLLSAIRAIHRMTPF